MKFILDERYWLRGWQDIPTGLLDTQEKRVQFLAKNGYLLLLRCDGAHDIDPEQLTEAERKMLDRILEQGIVRKARFAELLKPEQEYKTYPTGYRSEVHWSITGACNLKCRHCFMSAPYAKHGSPSHEQILAIADQLAECGVFRAGLTGGEPLIREDFWSIADALKERGIGISIIYTNGWLVDEALLDGLESRGFHPAFQFSFDGIGWHDFLRGVPGAEERTVRALKLLQERKHPVSVSMCIHRKSRPVLRDSVNLLASLGVRSIKVGSMMEMGEWLNPELRDLQLTEEEELEMFLEYIPQYFEDNAPVSIMMSGAFMYTPGDEKWAIYNIRECTGPDERLAPSCGVLTNHFYIGADGMVCPCMGMGDCGYALHFPNLFETPLRDILNRESRFSRLCGAKVGDIRDHNPKCRECRFVDKCTGGCRNSVLINGDDYYGVDEMLCRFFESGAGKRVAEAARAPFEAYLKRNPPRREERPEDEERTPPDCP